MSYRYACVLETHAKGFCDCWCVCRWSTCNSDSVKHGGLFFGELKELSVKDLGTVSKFLGMRIDYDDGKGNNIDQEVTIPEMLHNDGLEEASGARTPIGEDSSYFQDESVKLSDKHRDGAFTIKRFQSLVGSLLWCSRPDISCTVHGVSRQTHSPTLGDYKIAKRIARYLQGTKTIRLKMKGDLSGPDGIKIVGYSDADFAADRTDRKSITGGWITVDEMPVSWMAKKQGGVSLSTMEAEYTAASVVVDAWSTWITSRDWVEMRRTYDLICG